MRLNEFTRFLPDLLTRLTFVLVWPFVFLCLVGIFVCRNCRDRFNYFECFNFPPNLGGAPLVISGDRLLLAGN